MPERLGAPLTARHKEVLFWAACGKTNEEIGLILGLSPLTCKNHIKKIMERTGTRSRTSLAVLSVLNQTLDIVRLREYFKIKEV